MIPRQHADRAASSLSLNPPETVDGEDRMLVLPYLSVAAAYARGGDQIHAAKIIESIPAPWDRHSQASDVGLGWVEQAYVSAGLFDGAVALAKTGSKDNLTVTRCKLVHELVMHGDFDRARKILVDVDGDDGVRSRRFAACQQIKQHKADGLSDWIDTLPSPAERALLDVTVETALVKNPVTGSLVWDFDLDGMERIWYPQESDLPFWLPNANGS